MRSTALLALVCTASTALYGQAWLGALTPEQRAEMRRDLETSGKLESRGLDELPLRLPADQDPYRDIRAEDLMATVRDLVAFSEQSRRDGDILWGRIMGRPATDAAADSMLRRFQQAGVDRAWVEEFPRGPQWWPVRSRLTLVADERYGASTTDYVFRSALPAPDSAGLAEPLEAEAIYVGAGRPADLLDRDVRGKIAVVRTQGNPSLLFHNARGVPYELFRAGAAGVILICDFPGNHQNMPPFSSESDEAPTFTLGGDDGDFLEELIGLAGSDRRPRIRMELEVERAAGWTVKNVYGMVQGGSDDYIIAIAHLDGWFQGASDNATGLAALAAWARHFASREKPLEKNLLLVATAGHHSGSPGVMRLIRTHRDWIDHAALILNGEHLASGLRVRYANITAPFNRGGDPRLARLRQPDLLIPANTENPRSLTVSNGDPFLVKLAKEAIERYGLVVSTAGDGKVRGDAGLFAAQTPSAPVMNFIEGAYWYHTTADDVAAVSGPGLERAARAFAFVIDGVDRGPHAER